MLAAATTAAGAAPPHYPQVVAVNGKPTPAESAAIERVLGASFGREWSDYERSAHHPVTVSVGHADLNGDGRADLIVLLTDYQFGYCGSGGCSGYALIATPAGYAPKPVELANFQETLAVLPAVHRGMHDVRYDDAHVVFKWSGRDYK